MTNNIRLLRKEKGWSMRELAKIIGAHFTTVAKIENGQRKLTAEWRLRFAQAFNVNPWDVSDADAYNFGPEGHEASLPVLMVSNGKNWKDVREDPDLYIQSAEFTASKWAFYINVDQPVLDDEFDIGSYVLVDPEDSELVDSHCYAVLVDKRDMRFFTFRSTPPRFEPRVKAGSKASSFALGKTPFVTVGKVLGVYMQMPYVAERYQRPAR